MSQIVLKWVRETRETLQAKPLRPGLVRLAPGGARMTTHNDCQSCGMPIDKDPDGGGTYSDGRKCHTYCSYCYSGGRFTQPDMTVDQMKAFCAAKLREKGFPGFVARLMVRNLHKLERWNVGVAKSMR